MRTPQNAISPKYAELTMNLTGLNYLGPRTSGAGSKTFCSINPATNVDLDPPFHEATPTEIDTAMTLAESAFVEYRRRSWKDRAALLIAIAAEIEALGDDLINKAVEETALPTARITSERARTTGQFRTFAALVEEGSWVDARIDRANPDRKPVPKPDVRRMLVPLGPVVVFGASNFPLAFSAAGGDTASALAAGCSVVIKAHPSHPATSELTMQAVLRALKSTNMPEGLVSMLHGISPDVSLALVRHPLTKAVGFTGSLRAGRALFDAAAARPEPIPLYAEMGSVNPVFILPRALKERGAQIAEGLKNSVTLGVGQFCTNPGVVVGLDDDSTRAFTTQLANLISAAPAGTMLNRNIGASYAQGAKRFESSPRVRVLAKSSAPTALPTQAAPVVFTTDADHFLADHSLREELFGPATIVVTGKTKSQLEAIARAMDGQLTATIHAAPGELEEYRTLLEILQRKVGRLILNGYPTGVEVCPAMHHGGPYPATTDPRSTSVGTSAILRFARPVCYQDFPADSLPEELRDDNPRRIWRLIDGNLTKQ
jgi:2,5-dioxopentanoate dehydrogenase